MRPLAFALLCFPLFGQDGDAIAPATTPPPARPYTFITGHQRLEHFAAKSAGPTAVVQALAGSGWQTWRKSPEEWTSNTRGYSQRVGYKFARIGVSNTIELGVTTLFNEDPRFFHLGHGGFGKRMGYAFTSTFTARRPDGSRRVSVGRFAGKFGGAFIANTWYPPSNDTTGDALRRVGIGFAFGVGFNVVKEFSPEIKRAFRRGH
jgi:hypothetical protein